MKRFISSDSFNHLPRYRSAIIIYKLGVETFLIPFQSQISIIPLCSLLRQYENHVRCHCRCRELESAPYICRPLVVYISPPAKYSREIFAPIAKISPPSVRQNRPHEKFAPIKKYHWPVVKYTSDNLCLIKFRNKPSTIC